MDFVHPVLDEMDPPKPGRDFDYAYDPIGNRETFSIDQATVLRTPMGLDRC